MYVYVYIYEYTYTYIHKMKYYSVIKKEGNLAFATTWMDFEGITLSKISETEKDV